MNDAKLQHISERKEVFHRNVISTRLAVHRTIRKSNVPTCQRANVPLGFLVFLDRLKEKQNNRYIYLYYIYIIIYI